MHTTPRKPKTKEETLQAAKTTDEKPKRSSNFSTPRPQKTTTDIYAQKKTASPATPRAPKKTGTTYKTSNVSPMTNQLKSSSTTSVNNSAKSTRNGLLKVETKSINSKPNKSHHSSTIEAEKTKKITKNDAGKVSKHVPLTKDKTRKEISSTKEKPKKNSLITNVTVNSPIVKKKILHTSSINVDEEYKDELAERSRTKTRTLNVSEAKILAPATIDNNVEMQNLTRKLSAKPKAFFVDLEDDPCKIKTENVGEDDYSYEDDFESYESDFESYHSDQSSNTNNDSSSGHKSDDVDVDESGGDIVDNGLKEHKDEEKMLDSGNFDLREAQRSAAKTKPMDFIVESSEDSADKKTSLTDEGFQDMSSSSATSSMRTVHVDVLERPLLIDFSKSNKINQAKQNALRRKQRAKDILNMITLHTMSFSLFELNPIPYDIYMNTYGRANYKQTEVQTNDDSITEETQTEIIEADDKWTQHPVKFSKNSIKTTKNKQQNNILDKFSFLNQTEDETIADNELDDYKANPLRIFLEQKDGVGSNDMLPYSTYKSKLEDNLVNMKQLKRFLKRIESRILTALSNDTDNSKTDNLNKKSSYPFSEYYITLSPKDMKDLNQFKIVDVIFSNSKSDLAMTVHKKVSDTKDKSLICLWDVTVKFEQPLKTLVAVDEVSLANFQGGADGVFVAALKDGSLHLWDLSERAAYTEEEDDSDVQILEEVTQPELMSPIEVDREWNLKNSHVGYHKKPNQSPMIYSCAFTTSANCITSSDVLDTITGLEVLDARMNMENGRKIVGQIWSLLRIGILNMWSIVKEKNTNTQAIGKAYWSRTKLEKTTHINLTDYIDSHITDQKPNKTFSLTASKRRINRRKTERTILGEFSRPKSAVSFDNSDTVRPVSAARRSNSAKIDNRNGWDNGVVCKDLKIMKFNGIDYYLIAKDGGEVISLTKRMGVAKVERLSVTSDMTSVTKLEVSPHGMPYFLAATDSGTLSLCSLIEHRVLLSLDCRNSPTTSALHKQEVERYTTDSKGRYIGTVPTRQQTVPIEFQATLKSVHWLPTNPCGIVTLSLDGVVSMWQLQRSDICPSFTKQSQALVCVHAQRNLAFVTQDGDVEVHRLASKENINDNLTLFQKYVALL